MLAELKEQCDTWNEYCKKARSQSNQHFKCIDEAIYFYEPEPTNWDDARQACSLKFDGSSLADLVQIPDDKKLSTTNMLKGLGGEVTSKSIISLLLQF